MTELLRVVPVDWQEYKAKSDDLDNRRQRAGWSRAYARQNQMLPYAGTCLTSVDLETLRQYLEANAGRAAGHSCSLAALLSAVLTTGRCLSMLVGLPVRQETPIPPSEPCLSIGSQWVWWLTPGRPDSEQKPATMTEPKQAMGQPLVAIPCSHRTRALLERMPAPPSNGLRLFPWEMDVIRDIMRHEIRKTGVRSSLRLIENWLFQRLVEMEYGDSAIAALITGNVPQIAQTVVHYSSLSTCSVEKFLACALTGFDTLEPCAERVHEHRIGSRYAPSIAEVSNLLTCVTRPLRISRKRRGKPVVEMHNAMTLYTVLFFQIATCARPTRHPLPPVESIDPSTGFHIIDDKPMKGNFKTRLIWVSPECQNQLHLYQSHLWKMREHHPQFIPDGHDGSPYLISDGGELTKLDRSALRRDFERRGWLYPDNFARHFVRSQLMGCISSEALHALFGHWHLGTEPWNLAAGLDPLAYRAELQDAIARLCSSCGLIPLRGI